MNGTSFIFQGNRLLPADHTQDLSQDGQGYFAGTFCADTYTGRSVDPVQKIDRDAGVHVHQHGKDPLPPAHRSVWPGPTFPTRPVMPPARASPSR